MREREREKERERERERINKFFNIFSSFIPLRFFFFVRKFRPQLIELISFKPKLLIRFIMNKSC